MDLMDTRAQQYQNFLFSGFVCNCLVTDDMFIVYVDFVFIFFYVWQKT